MSQPSAEPERYEHFEVLRRPDGSLHELGRGAMGVTYKAFDTNLRAFVALKVINAKFTDDAHVRERFLREARAAAGLNHPNAAAVRHLGQQGENYFYAMEFIEGETLESCVRRLGPLPVGRVLHVAAQIARALAAAHAQGIVHRDLKPANLMLVRHAGQEDAAAPDDDEDLHVKVIDFGLAKRLVPDESNALSLSGAGPIGTPYYMSPEQIDPLADEVDGRADFYSLGATMWYLLAGNPPFDGTRSEVFRQHLQTAPPMERLHTVPASVRALLVRLLAKDRANRPPDAVALRREIRECLRETENVSLAVAAAGAAPPGVALLTVALPSDGSSAPGLSALSEPIQRKRGRWVRPVVLLLSITLTPVLIHFLPNPFSTPAPRPLPLPTPTPAPVPTAAPRTPTPQLSPTATPSSTPIPLPTARIKRLLQSAQDQIQSITDDSFKANALIAIVIAQAKAGDVNGALKTAQALTNDFDKADALSAIAAAQAKAGDASASAQTLALALKAAQAPPTSDNVEAEALSAIAAAQAEAGDPSASAQTFALALKAAQTIGDDILKAITLRVIAVAQAKAGDVSGALKTAQTIGDDILKASAMRAIAAAQAKAGDASTSAQTFALALKAAQAITGDSSFKAEALSDIAAAQAKAGDVSASAQTLALALKTARAIKGNSSKTLSAIAAAQAVAGDPSASAQTFALALKAAQAITSDLFKANALITIAVAQAKAGDVNGALKTAQAFTDGSSKVNALYAIAGAQAKAGDLDAAEKTVEPLALGYDKAQGYLAIVNALLPGSDDD